MAIEYGYTEFLEYFQPDAFEQELAKVGLDHYYDDIYVPSPDGQLLTPEITSHLITQTYYLFGFIPYSSEPIAEIVSESPHMQASLVPSRIKHNGLVLRLLNQQQVPDILKRFAVSWQNRFNEEVLIETPQQKEVSPNPLSF